MWVDIPDLGTETSWDVDIEPYLAFGFKHPTDLTQMMVVRIECS